MPRAGSFFERMKTVQRKRSLKKSVAIRGFYTPKKPNWLLVVRKEVLSMKKQTRWMITMALAAVAITGGVNSSSYAADEMAMYTLNPVVVTATRSEKQDVDVPASTNIITAKDIQNKGYKSVADALEQTIGITSYSYANGGESLGGSISRYYVRGLDKGTLVLVNGAPVNIMNYGTSDGVPIDAVEKIEVIKGSNSVLYGAEAMGGVVNIITKQSGPSKATASVKVGNYNNGYQVGISNDKMIAFFNRDYYDAIERSNVLAPTSKYGWKDDKGDKSSFYISGRLTDKLSLDWSYINSNKTRYAMEAVNGTLTGNIRPDSTSDKSKFGSNGGKYRYDSQNHNVNLIYNDQDSDFKSILAYNSRKLDSHTTYYNKDQTIEGIRRGTNYTVSGITFDNQKTWNFREGKDKLITGVTYKREKYDCGPSLPGKGWGDIARNQYSIYSSYAHEFTPKFTSILGVRGEFVQDNGWDKKQNVFLPQLQLLYKVNDSWSLYSNVGKSFDMPAINTKFYSDKLDNKNFATNPQQGWSYEFGSKYINGKDSLKLAIFHMDIKDKFDWVKEKDLFPEWGSKDISVQINIGKYKNTGFETVYEHIINDNWSYNAGFTVSSPKAQDKNGKWSQVDAKLQGNTGVQYNNDKWSAGLNLFVTAKREEAYYHKGSRTPNRIQLNSTVSYSPNKDQAITLSMYNLLDRRDSLNKYENWDLPFNWTLTYKYSF